MHRGLFFFVQDNSIISSRFILKNTTLVSSTAKITIMLFPIGDDNVKGGHYPVVSYTLLAINILVFLLQLSQGNQQEQFILNYGAIPAEITHGHRLYTLVTSMFLHGSIGHIVGNMLFLWIFADNIEAVIGSVRFFIFYLAGGLAAHAAHIFFNAGSEIPTVGASGAIAAVLGAYLIMFPQSQVKVLFIIFPFKVPALLFLGFWIFSQFQNGLGSLSASTAETDGIAYWAHIGGFAFGAVRGFPFRNEYTRELKKGYQDEDLVN
jgi:membrane associated rhomboid family serine protease